MRKPTRMIGLSLLVGAGLALGGSLASAQGKQDTRPQMQRGMGQGGMMGRPMMMRMHRMMAACDRMMGRMAAHQGGEQKNRNENIFHGLHPYRCTQLAGSLIEMQSKAGLDAAGLKFCFCGSSGDFSPGCAHLV